jgi:hypothetical protein
MAAKRGWQRLIDCPTVSWIKDGHSNDSRPIKSGLQGVLSDDGQHSLGISLSATSSSNSSRIEGHGM